jgi:hypothetical protein
MTAADADMIISFLLLGNDESAHQFILYKYTV